MTFSHMIGPDVPGFVVIYCPAGPYSAFLSDFADFLCDLVLSSGKINIVGDFNTHVNVENNHLNNIFYSAWPSCLWMDL